MSLIYKVAKKLKVNELEKKLITEPIRNIKSFAKEKIDKIFKTNEIFIDERQIITITRDFEFKHHIILLHGGSYRDEALILHRKFAERLAQNYDYKVTFIDYPLSPEYNYEIIQKFTYKAMKHINKMYNEDIFYLIGDSAGGGLSLSMLQMFRDNSESFIDKTVLLSPWADVSMTNSKIANQVPLDFTLNLDSIIQHGKDYAAELNTKNELVSPIYGDLKYLGDFYIFTCDNELLYPDILKLHKKLNKSEGSTSIIKSKKELIHDWVLIPTKESKEALIEIIKFLEK